MTIVEIKKKFYSIPTTWNELTPEQLLQVFDTLYSKKYDSAQIVVKLLKILTGLSYRQWLKLKPEDVKEYLYLVSFLFEAKTNFTKQIIPVYEGLYGPCDEIANLLGGELVLTDHYYLEWEKDRENVALIDQLVAILYRPAKRNYDFELNPDGDCREPFNENISAWNADNRIKHWPINVKLAIATWYSGCRQRIVDDNDDVFSGSGEQTKYGMLSILRNIAKEGTHGSFSDVEKMPVGLIMIELNETMEEGKAVEAKIKQYGG